MKKMLFAVMCAVMLFGMVAIGYAERGDWRGGIRTRIHDTKQRIERGIDHGTLTKHEARKLYDDLDRILDKIDHMKRDGYLSGRERDRINDDLDRLDRRIRREKHNDDRRGDRGHRYRD